MGKWKFADYNCGKGKFADYNYRKVKVTIMGKWKFADYNYGKEKMTNMGKWKEEVTLANQFVAKEETNILLPKEVKAENYFWKN